MGKNFIPEKIYQEIIDYMPICCIDLVVKCENYFLLVKRAQEPCKNKWWLPGGRVLFNETLEQAARRKLKEEVNIRMIKKIKFLGVGEFRRKKGRFNKPVHTIASVYLVQVDKKEKDNVKIDRTSAEYRWFDKPLRGFSPYVKKFLKLADF